MQRLTIFAPSKTSTFKALDLPENIAGVMLKGLDGAVAIANIKGYNKSARNSGWGNQILMHEYVHHAMSNLDDPYFYPLWYSEGMAEYTATFRYIDGQVMLGRLDELQYRFWELKNNSGTRYTKIDVKDLFHAKSIQFAKRGEKDNSKKRKQQDITAKFYARSVATLHFLYSSRETRAQLENYLDLLNQGLDIDHAYNSAFSMSYNEMDDAILDYISGKHVKGWVFGKKGGSVFTKIEANVKKMQPKEVSEELALILSKFGYFKKSEKQELFSNALQKAGKTEALIAQHALFQHKYLNKKDEQASKEFQLLIEDGLQAFPNNPILLTLKAHLLYAKGRRYAYFGYDAKNKPLIQARKLLRKAITADPSYARAYYTLGKIAALRPNETTQFISEAKVCMESARLLSGNALQVDIAYSELMLNIRLGDQIQASKLLRRYMTLAESYWQTQYGRFMYEAFEFANLDTTQGKLSERGLDFELGSYYQGDIVDGIPHGQGTLHHFLGGSLSGNWQKGSLTQGKLVTSHDYTYEGEFEQNLVHGQGVLNYPEGNYIDFSKGGFVMAIEHGQHEFHYTSGRSEQATYRYGDSYGKLISTNENGQTHTLDTNLSFEKLDVGPEIEYIGKYNNDFQAHGEGWCLDTSSGKPFDCHYENGKEMPKPEQP